MTARAGDLGRRLGPLLAGLGLAGFAGATFAQAGTSISDLVGAASSPTDAASGFFRFLLGSFWDSPLSAIAGGNTGLFGTLFAIYNAVIFVIGVLWASYGIGSAIVDTANSGEALGKRISTVWMPIRMVTGLSGIVPVFGGFSLSQVVLVLMATLGIGAANLMTNAAIDASDRFNTIMSPAAAVATSTQINYADLAGSLFKSHVCALSYEAQLNDPSVSYAPIDADRIHYVVTPTSVQLGSTNSPKLCGGYTIEDVGGMSTTSTFGFRTGSVDYGAYAATLRDAAQTSVQPVLTQLDSEVAQVAATWYTARHQSATPVAVPYPLEQLNAAADAARQARAATLQPAVDATLQSANGGALADSVKAKMKSMGFAGVGAWYSTFAESGAAFSSALDSVSVKPTKVSSQVYVNGGIADDMRSIVTASNESPESSADAGHETAFWSWLCHAAITRTDTGNCSLGQSMVVGVIHGTASGTGGSNLVNPIIMFKDLGDSTLNIASALSGAVVAAKLVGADGGSEGEASTLESKALHLAGKIPGIGFITRFASVILEAAWLVPYLVVLGLLMSIYIPMIPFITWMGGITQYVVIFCQGIVGMPIAAFAHLDSEGEGLGRRTEAGYMFVLNVTFRPALMLFGFFMASGLMIVLGTFQVSLFETAMANAQGNSITGLYSVIGYLVLFAVINVMLIQSLFNMIHLLPDQILSLVGSAGSMADLGKEAEGKIHALFMSTGKAAQGAIGSKRGDGKGQPASEGKAGGAGPAADAPDGAATPKK